MDDVKAIGDGLRAAGFSVDGVQNTLSDVAQNAMDASDLTPAVREWGAQDSQVAALARLFIAGQPVTVADCVNALDVTAAQEAGLVEVRGDTVSAIWSVSPHHDEWFVVADFPSMATGARLHTDYVLGVGGATKTLLQMLTREPVSSVWDMGTGCGALGLHASTFAQQVVCTDLSQRAVQASRLTAALSGVTLDVRQGSFDEPVADESFDLIVTNPPFVISPTSGVDQFEYRGAGFEGDTLLDELLTRLPQRVSANGRIQLLANWEVDASGEWEERLSARLDASGMGYWVVARECQDPAEYARLWLDDEGETDHVKRAAATTAWLDDFERRGVESIRFGVITLGQGEAWPHRGGQPVRRIDEAHGPLVPGAAGVMGPSLVAAARWESATTAERVASRWKVTPDVTEERFARPGAQHPNVIQLRQNSGFSRTLRVGTTGAAFVGACDGDLTVGEICAAIAHVCEVSPESVTKEVWALMDDLTWSGMLEPHGS